MKDSWFSEGDSTSNNLYVYHDEVEKSLISSSVSKSSNEK